MKKWLMLICMLHLMLPLWAQQMEVCDYARQKKGILWGLLNKKKPTTDKKLAIIDLKTGEEVIHLLVSIIVLTVLLPSLVSWGELLPFLPSFPPRSGGEDSALSRVRRLK